MNAHERPPLLTRLLLPPLLLAALSSTAIAQSDGDALAPPAESEGRWLVVPVTTGDDESGLASESGVALRAAMGARGMSALTVAESRARFEERGSIPASELSPSDIERWVQHSQAAVRHLARADYRAARDDLLEAQQLSRRAAEALNREAARARQVLDTCLYMVRTLLETGDMSRAEEQARECRRLVPRVEPTAYRHTPEVRRLLARVDVAVAAEPPSQLRVESSPSGCAVRLNGIAFGETPFRMDDLAPGDYRLQVECDPTFRGRVRLLSLPPGETTLRVDSDFDRAISSRPELSLRYAGTGMGANADAAWMEKAALDARRLGRAVGAERILLVSSDGSGGLELLAVATDAPRSTGRVHVPVDDADAALDALIEAHWHENEPRAFEPQGPPPGMRRTRAERVGLGLSIAGGAALATAWALHGYRYRTGVDLAASAPQTSEATELDATFEALRAPTLALGLFGGALSSVAVASTPLGQGPPPWWSYALGGVGVVLSVGAVVVGSGRSRCDDPTFDPASCIGGELEVDRAILLAASALPLLTLPLSQLLRGEGLEVDARVGRDSFSLGARGSF